FSSTAEEGIRDWSVRGVQPCALPISVPVDLLVETVDRHGAGSERADDLTQIGRASCRERGEISVVAGSLKKKRRVCRRAGCRTVFALLGNGEGGVSEWV